MAEPSRRSAWTAFGLWSAVGAALALGFLTMPTIGVFVAPIAMLGAAVLATRTSMRRGVVGVVSGLGVPLLYVAHLNRGGPGTVCTTSDGGVDCADQWSPWPWLGLGVVMVALGVAMFARCGRGRLAT